MKYTFILLVFFNTPFLYASNWNDIKLVTELKMNYGQENRVVLVGKSLKNGNTCYLDIEKKSKVTQYSFDDFGMANVKSVWGTHPRSIILNEANQFEISDNSAIPSIFGERHQVKATRINNKFRVELKRNFRTINHCEYNLDRNKLNDPLPIGCTDKLIADPITTCHFANNIGIQDIVLKSAKFDLTLVSVEKCTPGRVVKIPVGYGTQNEESHYTQTSNSTGMNVSWLSFSKDQVILVDDAYNTESEFVSGTELRFNRIQNTVEYKVTYDKSLIGNPTAHARFKCEPLNR